MASLFTTWLEFPTKLDGKIFCLHFEVTSDTLCAVMESGFVRLPLRKFTKPSDSLDCKPWFCRFHRQRVCHARAKYEVCIWRQTAGGSAGPSKLGLRGWNSTRYHVSQLVSKLLDSKVLVLHIPVARRGLSQKCKKKHSCTLETKHISQALFLL